MSKICNHINSFHILISFWFGDFGSKDDWHAEGVAKPFIWEINRLAGIVYWFKMDKKAKTDKQIILIVIVVIKDS